MLQAFNKDASDRVRLEIRILEALGDAEGAQALRWKTFEATLDGAVLRDYLAVLGHAEPQSQAKNDAKGEAELRKAAIC